MRVVGKAGISGIFPGEGIVSSRKMGRREEVRRSNRRGRSKTNKHKQCICLVLQIYKQFVFFINCCSLKSITPVPEEPLAVFFAIMKYVSKLKKKL